MIRKSNFGQRTGFKRAQDSGFKRNPSFGNRRNSFRTNRISNTRPKGRYEKIDPSLFVKKAAPVDSNESTKVVFTDFPFSANILKNLSHKKFINPTPIQEKAIPHILEGKDLIGLANTGTGKTAAFLLPLIDKASRNHSEKVLIIAPTRELAMQIEQEFRQFSWDMKLFSASCVGGVPIHKQIFNLKRNPAFIIGTPGRLKDLIERKQINLALFKSVVLDEVDRMLDMGFIDDIKEILGYLPKEKQSLFFSATMPDKIQRLTSQFLVNPVTVQVRNGNTAANVEQDIVRVFDRNSKFEKLTTLLKDEDISKVLIFIETKSEVERIALDLIKNGFKADYIHGDKRQNQRQRALVSFKKNETKILVATDVAARGLDIDDISHVINYTIPQTYDDYIHRIGRTGRGTNRGTALTFVS